MKKALITSAALASLAFSGSTLAAWTGWNIHNKDYPITDALESFIENAEKVTDGRVSGTLYNGAVLGSQGDAIQMMQIGSVQFAGFSLGPMGTEIPEANIVSLPFIFKNVDHMHRVLDGPFGQRLSDAMSNYGIKSLGWYDAGSRSFYNSVKPITKPSDVEGMKFRVMNNELYVGMIAALGGNATPMAFNEVYQSLKTGVVDGAENNPPSYESTNHYEVAEYYSLSHHLIIPECLCVSTKAWNELSAEDQAALQVEADKSVAMQRKSWAEREAASRSLVEKAGVKFNEVEDINAFASAMKPVYEKAIQATPVLASYIEEIQSID
ncbi:TRAP transporter substrate-binding protein [Marinomonas epiphytica]